MEELFKSLSENVSEECYNEILNIIEEIIVKDLETSAAQKYGQKSPQFEKAKELGDAAYEQGQKFFGPKHDLSTRNDRGVEKFNKNRLNQVAKREAGRNKYITDKLKSGVSSLIIPKQVTRDSSLFSPNTNMNPADPESGLSKARNRKGKILKIKNKFYISSTSPDHAV